MRTLYAMSSQAKVANPPMRKARNSLSADLILDAAERLAADNRREISIREIANELGSSPMALYRHFSNKDELINSLLNRVLARFVFSESDVDWKEDIQSFALAHKKVLDDHPWALPFLFSNPAPGTAASRIGEIAFAILHRGGITGGQAVATFSGIIALNYGWSSFVNAQDRVVIGGGQDASLESQLIALPPDEFPLTRELSPELAMYGNHNHYKIAIATYCAGLNARRN